MQFDMLQVFEDANEAVKYCDLLEGGGQGCEGVAEIEASSVQRTKHFIICHCSFCCLKKLCTVTFALFLADIWSLPENEGSCSSIPQREDTSSTRKS